MKRCQQYIVCPMLVEQCFPICGDGSYADGEQIHYILQVIILPSTPHEHEDPWHSGSSIERCPSRDVAYPPTDGCMSSSVA